ncbi:MAG: S1C family serine protease [Clostridium sp.]|uniref:S1C family serine protease n=1 Tax=Clostridium sp. TaxID=1506 RepID=UPI003F3CC573
MKDNNDKSGNINIKRKTNIITKKNVLIVLSVIVLSVITGICSVTYVLFKVNEEYSNKPKDTSSEFLLNADAKSVINIVGPSLVTIGGSSEALQNIKLPTANTTGVVLNKEGLIITSYSAIKDFKDIYVKLSGKGVKPVKGVLIGEDKALDAALIKISGDNLTPIKVANEADVKEGNVVFAVGNNISDNYVGMITPGIITSTNHMVKIKDDKFKVIQTSAVMNDENFAGVLCNPNGEMVGMNSKLLTDKFKKDNLYFAIGNEALKKVENEIIKSANIVGINGSEIDIADRSGERGFYINDVIEDGKAYKAGIKVTDIIIKANNVRINSTQDLVNVIKSTEKGGKINFVVLRNGTEENISITI